MGLGSGSGLAVSGTVALTACRCEACAGLAVWASAVKLGECEPINHAATARERQESAVMRRTDEKRKVPPRKTYPDSIVAVGGVEG